MTTVEDLMLRHDALKEKMGWRDKDKKSRTELFNEQIKADMIALYGDVDAELEECRAKLEKLVAEAPDRKIENSLGKVRVYDRNAGFTINDPASMATWLIQQKRPEVITFAKTELNKILNGLTAANLELPGGAQKELTQVLEVKIARSAEFQSS